MLWRAEAAVELNNLEEARQLVNQIRARAANTVPVKKLEGTEDAANYNIATYESTWMLHIKCLNLCTEFRVFQQ